MSSPRGQVVRRRARSVAGVMGLALVSSVVLVPLLLVLALVDVARLRPRLPLVRLVAFAWCWAWLETAGVLAAALLWATGRRRDLDAHYRLQRWWAGRLMGALRATCGVVVDVEGAEQLQPGPTVVLARHASLADSLLTAWVVSGPAGLDQRVVLKRELLADPCLDIVGNRLPNCFIDRDAEDAGPGLARIEELGATMARGDATVIFPEGTRANAAKRQRALERIAAHDPARAERLEPLTHLLPPRPSGTSALLRGAAKVDARIVVGCHVGFDGLDTFSGILAALGRPHLRVHVRFDRVEPPEQLEGPVFEGWLDDLWLGLDRQVAGLTESNRVVERRRAG